MDKEELVLADVPLPFPSMPRNLPDFGVQSCIQIPVRAARSPVCPEIQLGPG